MKHAPEFLSFEYDDRQYSITRPEWDRYDLCVDGERWDSYETRDKAIAGMHHHAGRMDERSRWKWPAAALFVVAVIGWVL